MKIFNKFRIINIKIKFNFDFDYYSNKKQSKFTLNFVDSQDFVNFMKGDWTKSFTVLFI